jgi:hypothetical protein
MSTMQQSITSM